MSENDIRFNVQDFAPTIGKVERFISSMSSLTSIIDNFSTYGLDLDGAEQEVVGISRNLASLLDSSSEINEIRLTLERMLALMDPEEFKKLFENNEYLKNIDLIQDGLFDSIESYDIVLKENSAQLKSLHDKISELQNSLNSGYADNPLGEYYFQQDVEKLNAQINELQQQYNDLSEATYIIKYLRDQCFYYTYGLYTQREDFENNSQLGIASTNLKWDDYYQQFYVTIDGKDIYYTDEFDINNIVYYDKNGNEVAATPFEIAQFFSNNEFLGANESFNILAYMDKNTVNYYNAIQNRYMTQDEINILNYLSNTNNGEKLTLFENFTLDLVEQRHGMALASPTINKCEEYKNMVGTTQYSDGVAYIYTEEQADAMISSIMFGAGLKDGLKTFANGLSNLFSADGKVSADEYKTQYLLSYLKEQYQDNKVMDIISTGSYEIANSIGNMLPSMLVSSIPSMQFVGLGLMGASATGNAREQGLQMGMTDGGAWLYGVLNGLSETGLQYFLGGISKLSSGKAAESLSKLLGIPGFVAELLSEGTEESLQAILDPLFKSIATNGAIQCEVDWNEVLKSGIYGMITAGIMNGSGNMLAITINGLTYNVDNSHIDELINEFGNEDLTNESVSEKLKKWLRNNSKIVERTDFDGTLLKKEILEDLGLIELGDQNINELAKKLGLDIETARFLLIARQLYYGLNQRVNYDANYFMGNDIDQTIKDWTEEGIEFDENSLKETFGVKDVDYYLNYYKSATKRATLFENLQSESLVCRGWRDLMHELLIEAGIPSDSIKNVGYGHYWLKINLPNGMDLILDSTEFFEKGDDLVNCKAGFRTKGFVIWPEDVGMHRLRNLVHYYDSDTFSKSYMASNNIIDELDNYLNMGISDEYIEQVFSDESLNIEENDFLTNLFEHNLQKLDGMDGLDAYYFLENLRKPNVAYDYKCRYVLEEVEYGKVEYVLVFESSEVSFKYSKSRGYFDIK